MTFLNALLLGGTAAGAIPLAIHLLQRKDRKTVRWGAMQFLLAKTITQRRRLNIEQWLLLLVRISIPILLALCMARPLISSLTSAQNTTPISLVLLLDDSPSMAAGKGAGDPFTAAKEACSLLLKKLPRSSEVSIVPLTNPDLPLTELTVHTSGADKLLKNCAYAPAPALLSGGLEAAATIFTKAHQARRRIVLLSDFQKSNWSAANVEACKNILERLHAQSHSPSFVLFDAGSPFPENVAVESLAFTKLPTGAGQRMRFVATLRNYGGHSQATRTVDWKVDGITASTTPASIGARESTQLVFETAFKDVGAHTVEVICEKDLHPSDDSISASVFIHDPLKVLIINGRPSPEPLLGESDFLEIALRPKIVANSGQTGLILPSVIEAGALNAKMLSRFNITILADVRTLTKQQVGDLESFVRSGGGLLVFPGRQTDVDWSNKTLHNGGLGLLPLRMESLQNAPATEMQGAATISQTLSNHPVLEPFLQETAPFAETKIWNWYSLKNPPTQTAPPNTILALDNGEPLFVERLFGAGIVIQSALPCSAAWSNLPTRPAYLPLLQRLTLHAGIAAQPSWNITTGQPIIVQIAPKFSSLPVYLTAPDGSTSQTLPRKERDGSIAEFYNTRHPGIYHLTTADGEVRQYAVNTSREESDPARLEPSEIDSIATQLGATLAHNKDELIALDRAQSGGREVWRPLLWLLLSLLFAELFLNQRFASAATGARK